MLRVGIIGSGLIATKKHIPAFLKLSKKAKIVALCDVNIDIARKIARQFNIPQVYSDIAQMLEKEKPDIVDICTPPQTHAGIAMQALEANAHVLLEKPMAPAKADCQKIIEVARRHPDKKICIMHNKIFNPAFTKAKMLLDKGAVGDFRGVHIYISTPAEYMTSNPNHWAHKLPGGVLGETGPHAAYLAAAFLKDISDAKVIAKKILAQYPWSKYEDFRINLLAENGLGSVSLFYASDQWAMNIDIVGSDGIIKADLESQSVLVYKRDKLDALSLAGHLILTSFNADKSLLVNTLRYLFKKNIDAHHIGIRRFVESVEKGLPSPVSAEDGLEAMRILELMVERLG